MTDEALIASYFAKYEPATAKLGKALRARLCARLPGLTEVVYVYENQGSLVISYSPTGRGYDAPCSLAIYPGMAKLYFAKGPEIAKADPGKLLQGAGKGVRHVVLNSVADFDRAEIEALIAAALQIAAVRPADGVKGGVVIRAEAQKERARRAKKVAAKAKAKTKTKTKTKTNAKPKARR